MAGAGYKQFADGDVLTAAQVQTFLQDQAVMRFADSSARDTALGTAVAEGMLAYLDDTNEVLVYDGASWTGISPGYSYAGTRYYTSSGTFDKADPLGTGDIGLQAVRVKVVGSGGGGAGSPATGSTTVSSGSSGGGGAYAESFILAGSLSSSETVTVGAGGAAGAAGADGGDGNASSFGTAVVAGGGLKGVAVGPSSENRAIGGAGGAATAGDLQLDGSHAGSCLFTNTAFTSFRPPGGFAPNFGATNGFTVVAANQQSGAQAGVNPGEGGAGRMMLAHSFGAGTGAAGADGIVIVDCFV